MRVKSIFGELQWNLNNTDKFRAHLTIQGVVLVEALALVPVSEPDDRMALDEPFLEVARLEFGFVKTY